MCPEGSCSPWRACNGAGSLKETAACQEQVFWQDLGPCGESMLEQPILEGLYSVERTYAGAVLKKLQPMGRTHIGVMKDFLPWVGPHIGEEYEGEGAVKAEL